MSLIRRFFKENRAVVLVESALIVPIFIVVLALVLESCRISLSYALIESGLNSGIKAAKLARGVNASSLIKNNIDDMSFNLFDSDDLEIELQSADDLADLLYGGESGGGKGGQYVHVTVTAHIGILNGIVPNSLFTDSQINAYYINEPDY